MSIRASITAAIATSITSSIFSETAFSPADIANILQWLDASDASTITDTLGAVSQWSDKASTNHATQGTGIKQPVTDSVTINSLNALLFDGVDDSMDLPLAYIPFGAVTVFAVAESVDTTVDVIIANVATTATSVFSI
ncbi:unnamed protein product, partial [marine sediment metagenome]